MIGSLTSKYDDSPCKMCGSPVRVREEEAELSLADAVGERVWRRICTNPRCGSNTGDRTMSEAV